MSDLQAKKISCKIYRLRNLMSDLQAKKISCQIYRLKNRISDLQANNSLSPPHISTIQSRSIAILRATLDRSDRIARMIMTAKHNLSAPFSGQMVSNVVCSVTTVNTTATQTTTNRFCKTKEILAAEKTKSQICLKYTNI